MQNDIYGQYWLKPDPENNPGKILGTELQFDAQLKSLSLLEKFIDLKLHKTLLVHFE